MKDADECDINEFSINESEYNDPDESGISVEQAIRVSDGYSDDRYYRTV